jgi:Mg2+ and Co2+ transporter CorA
MDRLSVNEMTTYRWSFDEDVAHYRQAGITAIGVWRQKLEDYGETKGIELLRQSGLHVSNVLWAGGFTGSDGHTFEESLVDAAEAIRLTAALGSDCLVVYSGGRNGHTLNHAHRLFKGGETEAAPHRAIAQRIFRLRQRVVRFRRLAAPMREVVDLLTETATIVTPALLPYFRDVLDHVIRMAELSDNVRDLLTSARELQLAQVANRQNVVMKQLTAWAAIILIPTLIAGIYGMNFRHMPELDWAFGYPFALALMGVTAYLLYRSFRKREWL